MVFTCERASGLIVSPRTAARDYCAPWVIDFLSLTGERASSCARLCTFAGRGGIFPVHIYLIVKVYLLYMYSPERRDLVDLLRTFHPADKIICPLPACCCLLAAG